MKTVAYLRTNGIYYDSRATKEITALSKYADKVIVYGWDREGNALEKCRKQFTQSDNIAFFFYEKKIEDGIGLRNIDKLIGWFCWIYRKLKETAEIDIVHACDLDTGLPAYWFCKKQKIPLVYDIYDYYTDCHSVPGLVEKFVERKEINIINWAECTIICTEERIKQISKSKPQKVIVLHNSPEVESYPERKLEYDYAYFGGLNDERMIGPILQEYCHNTDLRFCRG